MTGSGGRMPVTDGRAAAAPAARTNVRQAGIAQATLGYAITGLGACIVLLAADLDLPPARLAWLPATFGFGLLVMALTGPLLLRPGPRPALTGGSLLTAGGVTLLALAPAARRTAAAFPGRDRPAARSRLRRPRGAGRWSCSPPSPAWRR